MEYEISSIGKSDKPPLGMFVTNLCREETMSRAEGPTQCEDPQKKKYKKMA